MRSHTWLYFGAGLLIILALASLGRVLKGPDVSYTTEEVRFGAIREIVSVSGSIEAENNAELAFPVTGIVDHVYVNEGDEVEAGDLLISLERASLLAERRDAVGALLIAQADKAELIAGPRDEARDVTVTSIEAAEENLIRVTKDELEKVDNARRTLYSDDLEAFAVNKNVTSNAPTVTGTYTCESSGEYELEMFASSANSGFSYKLTGLESGVYSAYTNTTTTLGDCGLIIQFTSGGRFGGTDWKIPVPNTNGASYVTNLNTFELAIEQRNTAIAEAEEALTLARKEQTLENAAPRTEELDRAKARILQAQARLDAVDAALNNRIITAPFSGIITDVLTLVGETVTTAPVVTLLSEMEFELTARIPEIDIAKINNHQKAEVLFDAQTNELLAAEIIFISPLATEIDGVAYFEAALQFTESPHWLRSGLNADIDIIIDEKESALFVSNRYVIDEAGKTYVLVLKKDEVIKQEVEVGFSGNDGFVEIIGLNEGTTVVAP